MEEIKRLIVFINIALGTTIIVVGLLWPVLQWTVGGGGKQYRRAAANVALISDAYTRYYVEKEEDILFSGQDEVMTKGFQILGIKDIDRTNFMYEIFKQADGETIVRAFSRSDRVKKNEVMPALYEYNIATESGGWRVLSIRDCGIINLINM